MPRVPKEAARTKPSIGELVANSMPKHAGGRPSKYNADLSKRICDIVATNTEGLKELCKKFPEIPTYETINQWRWKYPEFSDCYARAKMFQAELIAELLIEMSVVKETYIDSEGNVRIDGGSVASQRLQVDTIKWMATKLAPKIYGDKVTHEGKITIAHEDALKALE